MTDTKESLAEDPTFAKYARVIKLTHADPQRIARNQMEDGMSEEDIDRFARVFDPDYVPKAAPSGENGSLKERLDAMERSIIAKFEKMILDREERIIAAIEGAPAAERPQVYTAAAAADPVPKISAAPAAPAAAPAARQSQSAEVESDFELPNKSEWIAIKGVTSTSGVYVESRCKLGYDMVRRSRSGVRWVMFEFDPKMEWIIPTKKGMATEDYRTDWANFVTILPDKQACYVLYNFEYADAGGSGYAQAGRDVLKSKMTLFAWTDSGCKVKERMVAASSQSAIKQVCKGSMDQAVHDKKDMEYDYICTQI